MLFPMTGFVGWSDNNLFRGSGEIMSTAGHDKLRLLKRTIHLFNVSNVLCVCLCDTSEGNPNK